MLNTNYLPAKFNEWFQVRIVNQHLEMLYMYEMSCNSSFVQCESFSVCFCVLKSIRKYALATKMADWRRHVAVLIRAERYCHFSIMIDTKATIHDTE